MSHVPVLKKEWLNLLKGRNIQVYVDGTLGAGGHAEAVLEAHPEIDVFVGIDRDRDAIAIAGEKLKAWKKKLLFIHGNFAEFEQHMKKAAVKQADAVLLDVGVSSMQIDRPERGFSFMRPGPLDMRMDQGSGVTAEEIVNTWSEEELGTLFRKYGEEKRWKAAARAIVQARSKQPISSTKDLARALEPVLKRRSLKEIHPLTLVFQALRIAVNQELDALQRTIPQVIPRLRSGGIFGIIDFHSLEDRLVKRAFQEAASDKVDTAGLGPGVFLDKTPLVRHAARKPIQASNQEILANSRARSAKLRAVEKI